MSLHAPVDANLPNNVLAFGKKRATVGDVRLLFYWTALTVTAVLEAGAGGVTGPLRPRHGPAMVVLPIGTPLDADGGFIGRAERRNERLTRPLGRPIARQRPYRSGRRQITSTMRQYAMLVDHQSAKYAY